MATNYTAKKVGNNYEVYDGTGARVSTGAASNLANYGLSETNLNSGAPAAVATPTPTPTPVSTQSQAPAAVDTSSYVVKNGDSLSKIAAAMGVDVNSISGYRSGNPNLIYSGEVLTVKKPAAAPATPTDVKDANGANAYINSSQQSDYSTASKTDEPPVRSSLSTYDSLYKSITDSLTSNLPTKPAAQDLAKTYTDLRAQYGVTDLENQLVDLNKQASDLQAASAARVQAEKDKPVAMNVISGRISEVENQDNIRLNAINNSIKTLTSQLQTKYNVVDNIMKYTNSDYSSAVDAYNTQFTQNLNLMNTVKGIVSEQKTDAESKADDARANLQIIYNNLSSGGASVDSMDATQKANITKLELQAGLPSGFYSTIINKNPKATILSTTTRESDGTKYADVIMKNDDGSLSTKTIKLGASTSGSDTVSQTQKLENARATVAPQLQAKRGSDGYVSPADYKKARDAWTTTGLSAEDFDKAFKQYANPESYSALGLTF